MTMNPAEDKKLKELIQQIKDLPDKADNSREQRKRKHKRKRKLLKYSTTKALRLKRKRKRKRKRKLVNQLITSIQKSENLTSVYTFNSRKGNIHLTTRFEDVYNDALGETFLHITQEIDKYNPEKPVMAWVNQTLKLKFWTAFNKEYPEKRPITTKKERLKVYTFLKLASNLENKLIYKLIACSNWNIKHISTRIEENYWKYLFNTPASMDVENPESGRTLHDSLTSPEPSEQDENHRLFRELIEKDPEGFLKNKLIKSHKNGNQISLQKVLLMRLENRTFEEISEKTGIPLKSIHSPIKDIKRNTKLREYITKHTGYHS